MIILKKIFITAIIIIFLIFLISFFTPGTSYKTYNNPYMLFQYPEGWEIEDNEAGGVNIHENSKDSAERQWFAVIPYGTNYGENIGTMDDFNKDKAVIASNTDPELIKTGNINGGSYTFYDNQSKLRSWKYFFYIKNGKGIKVAGYVEDPAVLQNVIATFY